MSPDPIPNWKFSRLERGHRIAPDLNDLVQPVWGARMIAPDLNSMSA